MFGGQTTYFKESFPPGDQDDFLMVSERSGGASPTPTLRRGPKNVIVYVLESVATQQLSLYGSKFKTTPRLEAEAGNCLIFDNFYTHFTNSANAVAAILLSTYPPLTWREYTVERPDLPGVTVANIVKPLGYRTAWISAGDNEFSNVRGFLQNRGFDDIMDYRDAGGPRVFSWGVEDRCHVDDLLRWIDRDRGKPFFLVSWNTGTHNPYYVPTDKPAIDFFKDNAPPITGAGGFQLDRYLNALHEADAQIGRLLDGLRQRNLDGIGHLRPFRDARAALGELERIDHRRVFDVLLDQLRVSQCGATGALSGVGQFLLHLSRGGPLDELPGSVLVLGILRDADAPTAEDRVALDLAVGLPHTGHRDELPLADDAGLVGVDELRRGVLPLERHGDLALLEGGRVLVPVVGDHARRGDLPQLHEVLEGVDRVV
jgi:hypothetical protein